MRKFILGTDWWTDCDDVVALRILARAHKNKQIKLEGVIINACMEYSASSLEGFLNCEGVEVPIGLDFDATDFGGNPPYQNRLKRYSKNIKSNSDVLDATKLYRKILANADEKIELIEIGYPQVLVDLLTSKADEFCELDGVELVRKKVSKICMMAGKWDENSGRENNFARNERSRKAAHTFCEICPVDVTFLGWEVGFDVITGQNLKSDDVLHLAMCDHGSANGRSSWDPMLVLLAIIGECEKAGFSTVCGKAFVDEQTGENYFEQNQNGKHKFVVKQKQNAFYENAINELIK